MEEELFELTEKQQRAFNKMTRAYKDCLKYGIKFYNNYGSIGALDGNKFSRECYTDSPKEKSVEDIGQNPNEFGDWDLISWADDQHWFHFL